MIIWPAKGPDEALDYEFDFNDANDPVLQPGETIASKTVTPAGITLASSDLVNGRTAVAVKLSAGVLGTVAKVTCTVTTSLDRTYSELGVLPIGGEVIALATAKAAQRIEGSEEDAFLAGLLRAAIGYVERATGRNLTAKVETQTANGFPCRDGAIRLFKGPVSEILAVEYDDFGGVATSLTSFRLVEGANARLLPAYGESWAVTAAGPGTVRVTYVAGYDPAELPPELTTAAILLFGHWNANREAVVASASSAAAVELPLGVEALIGPYRSPGIA